MPHLRWLILLLCSTAMVGPPNVLAQSENPEWHEIELIVFAREADGRSQTEEWPQELLTSDWSDAIPLTPQPTPDFEEAGSREGNQTQYPIQWVSASEYQLTGAKRQLQQTAGRLQPLLHLAWRQPTLSRDKAKRLYLQVPFENTPPPSTMYTSEGMTPRLEGTIKISRSRYLHIDLDLLLREVSTQNEITTEYGNRLNHAPFLHYRMQSHRRMRSKELHYIDHPLMGVLVQITPYEMPTPDPVPAPPETGIAPNPVSAASTPATDTPDPLPSTSPSE